jgi:hypothetical protein
MYIHHSSYKGDRDSSYIVAPGNYQEDIVVQLAAGLYKVEWIDPAAGRAGATETLRHKGGYYVLSTPRYSVDIALRIKEQE